MIPVTALINVLVVKACDWYKSFYPIQPRFNVAFCLSLKWQNNNKSIAGVYNLKMILNSYDSLIPNFYPEIVKIANYTCNQHARASKLKFSLI